MPRGSKKRLPMFSRMPEPFGLSAIVAPVASPLGPAAVPPLNCLSSRARPTIVRFRTAGFSCKVQFGRANIRPLVAQGSSLEQGQGRGSLWPPPQGSPSEIKPASPAPTNPPMTDRPMLTGSVGVMEGVREYGEAYPVELARCRKTGRLVVRAYNEGGNNHTDVDLWDLIEWLSLGGPRDGENPRLTCTSTSCDHFEDGRTAR